MKVCSTKTCTQAFTCSRPRVQPRASFKALAHATGRDAWKQGLASTAAAGLLAATSLMPRKSSSNVLALVAIDEMENEMLLQSQIRFLFHQADIKLDSSPQLLWPALHTSRMP